MDRSEECCDKQTEVEHRRASRGSPILCYLRTELHLSGFAAPRGRIKPPGDVARDPLRLVGEDRRYVLFRDHLRGISLLPTPRVWSAALLAA